MTNNKMESAEKVPVAKKKRGTTKKVEVIQCDLSGEPIQRFESISVAAKATGTNSSNIAACMSNKLKTSGGYIWIRADGKAHGDARIPYRPVDMYDKTLTFVKSFNSIADASRHTGIARSSINACVSGICEFAGNYIFVEQGSDIHTRKIKKNHGHGTKIDQYSMEGEFIQTFDSIYFAAKACGIHQPNISNCLAGQLQYTGGYRWTRHGEPLKPIEFDKCRKKRVAEVDNKGNIIRTYMSITECSNITGISKFQLRKELTSEHRFIKPRNFIFIDALFK